MAGFSRKKKWIIWAAVLIACAFLFNPIKHAISAARFALALKALAVGADPQNLPVKEASIRRKDGNNEYEALIYYPEKKKATQAIVLAAGLSEFGCYHPKLIAMSKLLANQGLMVITPDIPEYRKFQITAAPITQISFWLKQARSLPGGKEVRTIGLGGISFSGTIALITAARPEIRNEIGFVIAVGPYSNLLRCIKSWFAPDPTAVDKETYPTRFYAKWIIMLSALDMIAEEKDRLLLTQTLNALLLQKKMLPDAGDASPQGKRWYDFAVMHENQSDPELTEKIENHLIESIYPTLEPAPFLKNIGCPVFLIHGAYDDLIPSEESVELHQRIPNSYLLISPFLSHTHPIDAALGTWKKLSAVFETLIFSYRFSRQIIE